MVKVKVANPGPAALLVVNPKKRSSQMRKRRTTRRTTRRTASNPKTRRASVSSLRSGAHRRRNPTRSIRSRGRARARNPRTTGMFAKGLALAAGAALIQFTLGFVPPIGGVSPLADAARTAAVGWGLGTVMSRTGLGKQYADDVTLAGFTLAGGKLISSFILPFANRLFRPTSPSSQVAADQGSVSNGVQGIAFIHPGQQPFGAYSPGLNGIAVIDPSMQPYGEYAN